VDSARDHFHQSDDAAAGPPLAEAASPDLRHRGAGRLALLLAGEARRARALVVRSDPGSAARIPIRTPATPARAQPRGPRERASTAHIEVRTCHSSGKKLSSSAFARYDTPPVPPVPGL